VARSAFAARTLRSRTSNNRTRPYHDTSSRPSSHRKISTPCRYFRSGNCSVGDACRYRHDATPSSQDSELDRQLRVFVADSDIDSSQEAAGTQQSINDDKSLSPRTLLNPTAKGDRPESEDLLEEELYEVIFHPSAAVSEVRYHSKANHGELRTYFLVKRQPVMEYEGNNVGVLSGGVLLGVPSGCSAAATKIGDEEILDDLAESEIASTPSSSPMSNNSDVELWKGPVMFDDTAAIESLVWADEEFIDLQMEEVEPAICDPVSLPKAPTPPPVIRRIIRRMDNHNRRHSLS
jgi:hypothetical protein